MSLLWIDGFDSYGTSTGSAPDPTDILGSKYIVVGESSLDIETGRITDYALEFPSTSTSIRTPTINTNTTLIVGFAIKIATSLDFGSYSFLKLYDNTDLNINLLITAAGEITVKRGSTTLDTTSGLNLLINKWYWIELKTVTDNSSGSYNLKVGEVSVLSDSSIDTQTGSNTYCDNVMFIGPATTPTFQIDDLYICNGAGSVNNDFLGNVTVETLRPSGAGTTTQFTPSAGSNYECVDEEVIDEDTTYVEDDTTDQKDTYAYDNVSAGLSDIKGIQINTICRETDASSFSLKTVIRSGGSDYDDAGQAIGTTDYVTKRLISETDPDTSSAWAEAGLNAAEFGIKVG